MIDTRGSTRRSRRGAAVALLVGVLLAAGCETSPVEPGDDASATLVALIGREGAEPALFVQSVDGTGRRRIHFDGAEDPIPGNIADLPKLTDDNILALGPVSWSPDGERLAVVVTLAYDQSEVVVVDVDGTGARVASPNMQIIMTNVDWSPDGRKLAYGMSTVPRAGGIDVFMTELDTNRVRRLTDGAFRSGVVTDVRFDASAMGVLFAQSIGSRGEPLFDWIGRISRVELGSAETRVVRDSLPGSVESIARNGTWALILRNQSLTGGQDYVRDLVRMPLAGSGPELLLARGYVQLARLADDDRHGIVTSDGDPDPGSTSLVTSLISTQGGDPRALKGIGDGVYAVDVLYR